MNVISNVYIVVYANGHKVDVGMVRVFWNNAEQ